MSLWTPYEQEAALDLSKTAVKVELASPVPASSAPAYPSPPAGSGAEYYPSYNESQYYATYPYQPAMVYAVPSSTMMSPDSIGSWTHSRTTAPSPSEESQEIYDSLLLLDDDEEYQAYERDALQAMAAKNGGTLLGSNPRMRRSVQTSRTADDAYKQQRERNNQAAKQSRDRKKMREFRLASQSSFLQKKVAALRALLAAGVCGRCGSSE